MKGFELISWFFLLQLLVWVTPDFWGVNLNKAHPDSSGSSCKGESIDLSLVPKQVNLGGAGGFGRVEGGGRVQEEKEEKEEYALHSSKSQSVRDHSCLVYIFFHLYSFCPFKYKSVNSNVIREADSLTDCVWLSFLSNSYWKKNLLLKVCSNYITTQI